MSYIFAPFTISKRERSIDRSWSLPVIPDTRAYTITQYDAFVPFDAVGDPVRK